MRLRQTFVKVVAAPLVLAGLGLLTGCDGDPSLNNAGSPAPRVQPMIATSTPRDTSSTETATVTDNYVTSSRQDNRPVLDEKKSKDGAPIFVKGWGPIRLSIHAAANGGTLDPHKNYTVRLFWFDQGTQDQQPHWQGVRLYQERSETLSTSGGGFDWNATVDLPQETYTVYVVLIPSDAPAQNDGDWSNAEIVTCHVVTRVPDPAKATANYEKGTDQ